MSKAKTETKMDSFQSWAHRWGRVGTLIALIYMVALPFVVLAAYDSIPSLGEVFNVNTFSILLIYIPVGFSEALSYTPILGCSAYLAFITGNIMNLKLPVAANAMNLTQKQSNTPEGEAIASVAVAVSSLMTVAILTLAAVCASFISPVFELPAVKTASGYLLPALFGSMALGLFAFVFDTAGGVLFAKFLNLFRKNKVNPMIGAAGISAFPMSARVIQKMAKEEDPYNFILMQSISANVSGQLGSIVAGGMVITLVGMMPMPGSRYRFICDHPPA